MKNTHFFENNSAFSQLLSKQGDVLSYKMIARSSRVHWTLGSLRDLQAFFWLRVFSAPKQSPRQPQRQ
jgi:hypothetical protein